MTWMLKTFHILFYFNSLECEFSLLQMNLYLMTFLCTLLIILFMNVKYVHFHFDTILNCTERITRTAYLSPKRHEPIFWRIQVEKTQKRLKHILLRVYCLRLKCQNWTFRYFLNTTTNHLKKKGSSWPMITMQGACEIWIHNILDRVRKGGQLFRWKSLFLA